MPMGGASQEPCPCGRVYKSRQACLRFGRLVQAGRAAGGCWAGVFSTWGAAWSAFGAPATPTAAVLWPPQGRVTFLSVPTGYHVLSHGSCSSRDSGSGPVSRPPGKRTTSWGTETLQKQRKEDVGPGTWG